MNRQFRTTEELVPDVANDRSSRSNSDAYRDRFSAAPDDEVDSTDERSCLSPLSEKCPRMGVKFRKRCKIWKVMGVKKTSLN